MKGNKATIAALTVSATILVGITAFTRTTHQSHSWDRGTENTPATRANVETGDDCARLIAWLDQTTFPMLDDALAVPNVAKHRVKLERPKLLEPPQARAMQAAPCRREWTPLAEGSMGGEATITCPEAPLLQMPPYAWRAPLQLKMPSLGFGPAVTSGHPDASLLPNRKRAQAAGIATLKLLESQVDVPLTREHANSPERMPYLYIFGRSSPHDKAGV